MEFSGVVMQNLTESITAAEIPPTSSLDGEGTALINTVQGVVTSDSVNVSTTSNSKDAGGNQFVPSEATYGQPIRWTESVVRDPTGEWPVEVLTNLELQVDDPESLDLDAIMAGGYGECLTETVIDDVSVDMETGVVMVTLASTYECEPEQEETTGELWVQPPEGTNFYNPETYPEPTDDDDDDDDDDNEPKNNPSDPWLPTDPDDDNDDDNNRPDHYDIDWYQRRVVCRGACLPAGDSTTLPLYCYVEGPDIAKIEARMLFDETIVNVDAVNGDQLSLSNIEIDNSEGYIRFDATPQDSAAQSFDPIMSRYDDEWSPRFATIDVTTVGATGDSTAIEFHPPDTNIITDDGHILDWDGVGEDGRRLGEIGYHGGTVRLENGMALGHDKTYWGSEGRIPFSVDAATDVAGYTARLQIQRDEPVVLKDVVGVDLPDPEWSYTTEEVVVGEVENEDGEMVPEIERRGYLDIDVPADAALETHDPTLCEIVLGTKEIETIDDVPTVSSTAIKYNLSETELYAADGSVVSTSCNRPGSFDIRANVPPGPRIPQVGVAYWPLIFPMVFRYPGVDMSAVDRNDISVETSSPTNPDIDHKINQIVFGTPSEPDTLYVSATILIPKADPQEYPVEYTALLWIGRTIVAALGSGLHIGGDISQGQHQGRVMGGKVLKRFGVGGGPF